MEDLPQVGEMDGGFLAVWHSHRAFVLAQILLIILAVAAKLWGPSLPFKSLNWPRLVEVRLEDLPEWPQKLLKTFMSVNEKKREIWTETTNAKTESQGLYKDISVLSNEDGPSDVALSRLEPRRVTRTKPREPHPSQTVSKYQILVFFSSLTGSTEARAKQVVEELKLEQPRGSHGQSMLKPQLYDLSYIDYDDFFVTPPKLSSKEIETTKYFYILLLPTYNIDTVLDNFLTHLQETHHDFRVDTAPLSGLLGYCVFGFGDKEGWPSEDEGFCSQAKEVDKWMAKLTGGKRAYPLGMADVSHKLVAETELQNWISEVSLVLQNDVIENDILGQAFPGGGAVESDEEDDVPQVKATTRSETSNGVKKVKVLGKRSERPVVSNIDDLEDLGRKMPIPIDFTTTSSATKTSIPEAPKAMVPTTSPTYAALTKQGYSIIGTHSGVKICRWTKSALRGRGSCYKHSFYGIASHNCMETTPSLSCSNKCVFCWRHGTNPVGTTWRWQVDPPQLILDGAMAAHYQKIKSLRGVPGVRAERFREAMQIKHCALSLVGEPIFYPHINAFVALLHARRISSFLVCNAQHPEQLAALRPVTQLYLSIDASNRASLQKIDRPLHRDFWARFLACLDILRARRFAMRTVFRLTLVKGFNIDAEVDGYAALVARALPCFVEVKGVTYCGTASSAGAGLTMQNVPFYAEVQAFVRALDAALAARGLAYGIAAEHAHSCCVLLASERFFVAGKWHTLIDYERFFECLERGGPFRPEDYMGAETPEWAAWGRGGFDPRDERVDRKGRRIEVGKVEGADGGQIEEGSMERGGGVEVHADADA
ncbi:hypothetical protein MMC13_001052 [Lambiella insularis]|nr:hypothetical protein [Lambiella insularis]